MCDKYGKPLYTSEKSMEALSHGDGGVRTHIAFVKMFVTIQLILASGGPSGGQPFEKVAKQVFKLLDKEMLRRIGSVPPLRRVLFALTIPANADATTFQ